MPNDAYAATADAFRVVPDSEWTEALDGQRVRGADQSALMTHILPSVSPIRTGEKNDVMAFFIIPATIAQEVVAVVVGVVAADIVDNIIDRKFPEPKRGSGPPLTPQRSGLSPADFQVALLPPIPAIRSLSPHRGVPG